MNISFCVTFFVGNSFKPAFHNNIVKILRRIEETKAIFKNVPNEDIENARFITEFCLKYVNPKTNAGNLYIRIPDLEIQASKYEQRDCPESNYTYFFSLHQATLERSLLCKNDNEIAMSQ